jgi:hypothetical protein
LLLAGAGPAPLRADTAPADLQPYTARYQVSYRGLAGGQIESSLKPDGKPGVWVYSTRAYPNFLGRLALSPEATEHGTMEIAGQQVRPIEFKFDDGSAEDVKDVRHEFDWNAMQVTGTADGKPFTYDIEPGTQDTASVQAAMLVALNAGRSPDGFAIVTGGRLRQYRYWSEGTARVSTPAGEYDTVVWASQRYGSSRVSRIWHAPALGYVPVQAIQYRKGKAELAMRLASLSRP